VTAGKIILIVGGLIAVLVYMGHSPPPTSGLTTVAPTTPENSPATSEEQKIQAALGVGILAGKG
jgi:hypothetical protein